MAKQRVTVERAIGVLRELGGNRRQTAFRLGITHSTLQAKIKQAEVLGYEVPPALSPGGRPTVTSILREQGAFDSRTENPKLPDDLDSLPDPPEREPLSCRDEKHLATATSQVAISPEQIEQAGNKYGRRVDVMLAQGNWEAAKAIVDEARRDSLGEGAVLPLLEVPLAETDLPVRTLNILEESCDVVTVGDLAKVSAEQVMLSPNFSWRSLDAVWWSVLKLAAVRDAMRESLQMEVEELKRLEAKR